MAVITDNGEEWISQKLTGNKPNGQFYIIAVGNGTANPQESDTALANELYRADSDDSNCTIDVTSNNGEIVAKITISGGTEISNPPKDITEIGLFATDGSTLIYRETFNAITIESGDRQTLQFTLTITDN